MLKDNLNGYILKAQNEIQEGQNSININVEIFKEELEYIKKNPSFFDGVNNNNIILIEKAASLRFNDAYIERCDKETENVIAKESSEFLKEPVHFLKSHKLEFIYLESKWFDFIGVDAVSIEVDDAFGTYDVMLGLKLQKKYEQMIKAFLNDHLHGEELKFDLIFSPEDGLWNLNFTLNYIEGFQEKIAIGEAYRYIYSFLFRLVESVEIAK